MTSKNIIIAGAIAIGIYLLSQAKKIPFIMGAQKTAQRRSSATTSKERQRTAQKIAQKVAQKVAPKRIGRPTVRAAHIAALRKAAAQKTAVRKAAAQKIGKKIGKTVAQKILQKIPQKIKTRRAVMAEYLKRQRPQIERPRPNKKQTTSKLFPGAEKSRIIPYSESSKHSYYGPKSHKVLNEGYMEKRYKADLKQAEEFELNRLRDLFPEDDL